MIHNSYITAHVYIAYNIYVTHNLNKARVISRKDIAWAFLFLPLVIILYVITIGSLYVVIILYFYLLNDGF